MRPLYIFDLDGTLALCDHRQHLVRQSPPDWTGFFKACGGDEPNKPVIHTLLQLLLAGCEVLILSGRGSEARAETEAWLTRHIGLSKEELDDMLTMRPVGNTEPDDVIKSRWMDAIIKERGYGPLAVFDDRQKVVDMWRARGIACFQVRPSFD